MSLKSLSHWLPSLLGIALLSLSLWAIHQELQHYTSAEILHSLLAIPGLNLAGAIALTALNFPVFTGYETLALLYIQHPLPYRKAALAAISTPISNSVGFALLSGGAVRYRLYTSWGLSPPKIAQIIFFCNLSFWLGLFGLGGIVFLIEPITVSKLLNLPFKSAHSVGILFLAIIAAYLTWSFSNRRALHLNRWVIPHIPIRLCWMQLAIASLDWALAAAVLYVLIPAAPLSYPAFLSVYLLAQLSGLISNVPGGLGIFETVMLLLLSSSISSVSLFGSLVAYRFIYYFLPFILSAIALGCYELRQQKRNSR